MTYEYINVPNLELLLDSVIDPESFQYEKYPKNFCKGKGIKTIDSLQLEITFRSLIQVRDLIQVTELEYYKLREIYDYLEILRNFDVLAIPKKTIFNLP